jgi:hypothetical protein
MSIVFAGLLLVGLVVGAGFLLVKAVSNKGGSEGSVAGDLIAYGLLAIFIGGTVWALFLLGRAAFPGDRIVNMSQQDLAGALAGLIVSGPVAWILWRRQDQRRDENPESIAWSIYLAFMDLIFLTWLVVYGVLILSAAFGEGDFPRVTDVLIIAAVVGIHEFASRVDRPGGAISQIHRVVGSGIGLITLTIGVGWVLWWVFDKLFGTFTATAGDLEVGVGFAMLIVGAVVWGYKWLRPWATTRPDGTYLTYVVLVLIASLTTAIGTATAIAIIVLLYFFESPESPGAHFEAVPGLVAVMITAGLVWFHHRPRLGPERTDAVRAYQYIMAAIGLGTAIGSTVFLITIAFRRELLVSDTATGAVTALMIAVVAGLVWWLFWSDAQSAPRTAEAASLPRKFYIIGGSIILGLTAAGAVIGVLLFTFQQLLGLDPQPSTLATELGLALLTGAAAWQLYSQNKADGELREGRETRPYLVTVICANPGGLPGLLPREASLRVIYRGDGLGAIDDDTANRIVERTRGVDSIVWVSEDSFEVVPALKA